MNKRLTLNIGSLIGVSIAIFCLDTLLLDNIIPFSISSVIDSISQTHWSKHWHVLVIGLMPVYIGLMIFGTAIMGVYLGNKFQDVITQLFRPKPKYPSQCKNDAIHIVRKSPLPMNTKVS